MESEFESDFQNISCFQTLHIQAFLRWIRTVAPQQQKDAALGVTERQLQLRHLVPQGYQPRFAGAADLFDLESSRYLPQKSWMPRKHREEARSLANRIGSLKWRSKESAVVPNDSPLAIPGIRTVIELSTGNGDVVLLQFPQNDDSRIGISYVEVIGLGQTAFRINDSAELSDSSVFLRSMINMARQIVR